MSERHGGQILVDQLAVQGVRRVFCVPGESFLAVLDALHGASIQTVVCRHEGGAAMMAEAHGKLSGHPGVVLVTRGPGATNAAAGLHVAAHDSTPLIVLIGQVGTACKDRGAFQEMEYPRLFGSTVKWVAEVASTDRIPEYLYRAFHIASAGRPGPVVLALPEDVLSRSARVADAPVVVPVVPTANRAHARETGAAVAASRRPLVIVGGGRWSARASADLAAWAEHWSLPVAASFRRQDYVDNEHGSYAGDLGIGTNPLLAERVRLADTLLVLGARLSEVATAGYTLLSLPRTEQRLLHIHPGAEELGRVFSPLLAVNATPESLLRQLVELPAPRLKPWSDWTRRARRDYEAWSSPIETPGAVKLEAVVAYLRERLPADAILCNGAGNYTAWVHRYYRHRRYRTQLAPTSGSMGYGLPAAVAAKLAHPERTVVCFAGDGCFQMTSQELATAMQYDAAVIVLVVNNGRYGTIRMHQERRYPGRVSSTDLRNPDFAALAAAYGAFGECVEHTADFPAAFERAQAAGRPAVLELPQDPEALAPSVTLSALSAGCG